MATSGTTVWGEQTMSPLDSKFSEEHMKRMREETIKKWDDLGFLDGLKEGVQENIALLYESQASHLLNETELLPTSNFEDVQFPIVRMVMDKWYDQENRLVINKLKKHKL